MIKNALLLVCFLLGIISSPYAQEVRLDSIPDNSFSGLINSSNMNVAYFYYIESGNNKNTTNLVVKYVSNQFNDLRFFKIDISKSTFVQSSVAADNGFVFVLSDPIAKTRKVVLYDYNGKMMKQITEENLDAKLLVNDNTYRLAGIMPLGVIAVYKNNAKGYSMCKYDVEMKQEWVKEIIPSSDGRTDIIDMKVSMEKVVVLTRETKNGKQQAIQSRLMMFSTQDGSITTENVLKDGEDYCVPTFLNCFEGLFNVGGEYYKSGKYIPGAASGLMVMQYDESGQKMRTAKIPMTSIHSFLPDADISTISGKGMLLAMDGYNNEGGRLSLICEVIDNNYIESAKQSDVTVSDLMSITIDAEGSLEKLQLARNITPINMTLKGNLASGNILGLSNWLITNKLIHYRFSVQAEGAIHMCYMNVDKGKPHAVFIPSIDMKSEKEKEPFLLRLPEIESKVKWSSKMVLDDAYSAGGKCPDFRKIDMIPAMGSFIRMYNFLAPQLVVAQERNF